MLLTEHDLKELFPGKIGIVKKLCAHQAKVCKQCRYTCYSVTLLI